MNRNETLKVYFEHYGDGITVDAYFTPKDFSIEKTGAFEKRQYDVLIHSLAEEISKYLVNKHSVLKRKNPEDVNSVPIIQVSSRIYSVPEFNEAIEYYTEKLIKAKETEKNLQNENEVLSKKFLETEERYQQERLKHETWKKAASDTVKNYNEFYDKVRNMNFWSRLKFLFRPSCINKM